MEKINVKKEEVLGILKENRKKHKKDFKKAIKAYRVHMGDLFTKELDKILSGKDFSIGFLSTVKKPKSHVKDYDLVIQMLEMSVDDIIELEYHEFNQLINDDWNWKSLFQSSIVSNCAYFGMTRITTTPTGANGPTGCSSVTGISGSSYDVNFSEDEIDDEE